MKLIKPFRGLRPTRELAADIASHPYDVLNREEAFALAHGNPLSFLHVNKPEIDVAPEVSPYDPSVYAKGRENLDNLVQQGRWFGITKKRCTCIGKSWVSTFRPGLWPSRQWMPMKPI